VFLAGDPPQEVEEKIGGDNPLITVFMPNGPNPTTGFIVFMPASEVIPLDLAVEDAAKLVVSAGLVGPDQQQEELRKLAKAKAAKPVARKSPSSDGVHGAARLGLHVPSTARIRRAASSRSNR
jgi:uncharacterized membrane protein